MIEHKYLESRFRNDGGNLADSDQGKHLAWKDHYHRMPIEEFEWNKGV